MEDIVVHGKFKASLGEWSAGNGYFCKVQLQRLG